MLLDRGHRSGERHAAGNLLHPKWPPGSRHRLSRRADFRVVGQGANRGSFNNPAGNVWELRESSSHLQGCQT